MKTISRVHVLSAAAACALLAGCSGGSAIAPGTLSMHTGSHAHTGRVIGRSTCSATGSIRYVSDVINNVVNIYGGKFAGQAPCGQISSSLDGPVGLHVDLSTHDLYVANSRGGNILVYHRGELTPYNTYTDPNGQSPTDVTIAPDGTIVASNELCSLSTWTSGPNGGTYVGTFAKPSCRAGGITFLAVGANGIVYYVSARSGAHRATLWSVSCPGGNCGVPIQIPGARLDYFGSGVAVDSAGSVLAVKLSANGKNNKLATFNLPDTNPQLMDLSQGFPFDIAINAQDHLLFVANNIGASEYIYPGGKLVGTVPANSGGAMDGIAIDPQFTPNT